MLCQAGKDGECNWEHCPQLRDREPDFSGRHCPVDVESRAVIAEEDDQYLAECYACKGTGLYVGFMEKAGEAVVCTACKGSGGLYADYGTVYNGRKEHPTARTVRWGSGSILDDPKKATWIPYSEFLVKVKPYGDAGVTKMSAHRREAVEATRHKLGGK